MQTINHEWDENSENNDKSTALILQNEASRQQFMNFEGIGICVFTLNSQI